LGQLVVCRDFFYNHLQAVLFFQIRKKSLRSGKPERDVCIQKNLSGLFLESVDLTVQFYLRIGFTLEKAEKDKHFMNIPLIRRMQLRENHDLPFYGIPTKI